MLFSFFKGERLDNVHIELGPSLDSLTEIYYQEDAVEEDLNVGLDGSYSGQFVKIWIETTDYLTICEVEVYAEESMRLILYKQFRDALKISFS